MFAVTAAQRAALMGNHEMSLTVSVIRGSVSLGEIPIVEGNISATYATQGSRDGSITVDQNIIDSGLLNPLSDQVYIRTGIPGFVDVPIFTGRVDAHDADEQGRVVVPLLSRAAEAIRAAFETPWAAIDGNQARSEIQRVLQNVDGSWSVDIMNAAALTIGSGLVWEDDRGQALDQLARGASLIWQPDRTGGFVVYTNPYTITTPQTSASTVIFKDGVGGTVVNVQDAKSREGIYNSVTVVAERFGNQVPIRVTVRDNGATSPTKWGGIFGKQNLVVKSQLPIDVNGAVDLASRILRQSLALQRTWTITMPHFPIMDPGDVFGLFYRNEVTTQVLESVQYSVNAQDLTTLTSRELREISMELLT